jgi:hypothetical protein
VWDTSLQVNKYGRVPKTPTAQTPQCPFLDGEGAHIPLSPAHLATNSNPLKGTHVTAVATTRQELGAAGLLRSCPRSGRGRWYLT